MTEEQAEFIADAIENGGKSCSLHINYHGRSEREGTFAVSFGEPTAFILPLIIKHCKSIARISPDDIPEFGNIRQDSLGRGVILY